MTGTRSDIYILFPRPLRLRLVRTERLYLTGSRHDGEEGSGSGYALLSLFAVGHTCLYASQVSKLGPKHVLNPPSGPRTPYTTPLCER